MRKESLIDDVEMSELDNYGPPIMFQNPDIRKMLNLAKVKPEDIFYDLGSGWGQNLIIALTEFNVSRAIGIEEVQSRCHKSKERIKKFSIVESRGNVIKGDIDDLLDDKLQDVNISEATVVFYGLETSKELLDKLTQKLQSGCRLICYYNCLFPEIMPNEVNFPFFLYIHPFTKTTSKIEWLNKVTRKTNSSIHKGKSATEEELWDELRHDYDVSGKIEDTEDYKKRLNDLI